MTPGPRPAQSAAMHIKDRTDDTLVLYDNQSDKVLAMALVCGGLVFVAGVFAWNGSWIIALLTPAAIPCGLLYAHMSRIDSTVTFDRAKDDIALSFRGRRGAETWNWKLSELKTAEVSQEYSDSPPREASRGSFRPDLILTDGTRIPMRPYHSAGTQSWEAVAGVKLFLGQKLDDAPVGWIPGEAFDRFFKDEMAELYK